MRRNLVREVRGRRGVERRGEEEFGESAGDGEEGFGEGSAGGGERREEGFGDRSV